MWKLVDVEVGLVAVGEGPELPVQTVGSEQPRIRGERGALDTGDDDPVRIQIEAGSLCNPPAFGRNQRGREPRGREGVRAKLGPLLAARWTAAASACQTHATPAREPLLISRAVRWPTR